jgi:CubicO group peptidase (beta-lactamase class C family)
MPLLFAHLPRRSARAAGPLARRVRGLSFDQFVHATLRDYGVPGAVVAVSSADGTIFLKGYGVRRQGMTGAVDENTRFQIASMSKFITAPAVGVLVDRGVFSWDCRSIRYRRIQCWPNPMRRRTRHYATTLHTGPVCLLMRATY